MKLIVAVDGGAWPTNPGHAAYGIVVEDSNGNELIAESKYIGDRYSNNDAEYRGMLRGLALAREMGADEVHIYSDSRLVIEQLNGNWKIEQSKFASMKSEFDKMREGIKVHLEWVRGHAGHRLNERADGLVAEIRKGTIAPPGKLVAPRDGRRLLTQEVIDYFGPLVKPSYPWIRGVDFYVRPITGYTTWTKKAYPAVERRVWNEEMLQFNRKLPLLLAWRPYGFRPVPLRVREVEKLVKRPYIDNPLDGGAEMLFQWFDCLTLQEPAEEHFGPRQSLIMWVDGTWMTARDLKGIFTHGRT